MADPKPDLVELLRELEEAREAEGMPVGARNRVQLAIARHESRRRARWRRWVPAVSFVAGAALVLAVVGSRWVESPQSLSVSPAAVLADVSVSGWESTPGVGPFHVQGPHPDCLARAANDAAELAADCSLVAPHMTLKAWEAASVRTQGRNVHVRSGTVLFEVQTVPRGESAVEVAVSHGTIEVVGTRFAVAQGESGGHVDLLEGKIRFHHPEGRIEDVSPGERLSWGEPEPASPQVEVEVEVEVELETEPDRRRSRARGSDAQAAAVIERVTELRAQRRFGAATTELRRALRRPWDRRTAQVLSYELGELLRAAGDPLGACEHFEAHQRKYPKGRYASAIDGVFERLDCE